MSNSSWSSAASASGLLARPLAGRLAASFLSFPIREVELGPSRLTRSSGGGPRLGEPFAQHVAITRNPLVRVIPSAVTTGIDCGGGVAYPASPLYFLPHLFISCTEKCALTVDDEHF